MGFCRRCGDIVNGLRCNKCGGLVVAPAVSWRQATSQEDRDKWSQTYMSRERSASTVQPQTQSRDPLEGISDSSRNPAITPSKRFPRALGAQITRSAFLDNRITDHIVSTSSQSTRSPPPLRPTVTGPKPESGILPSLTPNDTTLSKVYGSVLQPKESLATHSCAACATPFLPDATIYPDPLLSASDEPRFLCRQCFIVSGGSKGICPNCAKPVTILKTEGGFVSAAGKYWHKKCFTCEACSKNIGDSPMVDLLGRPSCPECFDTCLSRESRTPKRSTDKSNKPVVPPEKRNPGGWDMTSNTPGRFRESSPAIEQLEQRLGIARTPRSREGSPAIEELGQRLSSIGKDYHPRYSSPSSPLQTRSSHLEGSPSPVRRLEQLRSPELDESLEAASPSVFESPRPASSSPSPTTDAIEEMKKRFFRNSTASPTLSTITLLESSPSISTSPLRPAYSTSPRNSFGSKIPIPIPRNEPMSPSSSSTPDFMSDISDSLTQSSLSGVDSPPRVGTPSFNQPTRYRHTDITSNSDNIIVEETKSQLNTPNQTPRSTIKLRSNTIATPTKTSPTKVTSTVSGKLVGNALSSTSCTKCDKPLFALKEGGKFVTVPGENASDMPQTFHKDCFRCTFCQGVFNESGNGQAIFVKSDAGPAHVECALPEKIVIRKSPSAGSLQLLHEKVSQRYDHSPAKSPSPLTQKHVGTYSSSRYERLPPTASIITTTFPRFGSRASCPGCYNSVSPMERGVIPGPQGSRWHADCLVCGGKRPLTKSNSWTLGRGEEKKKEPGCGKKLDSAAKTDAEGRIWCRECLLMLGIGGSPQVSPTRTSLGFTGVGLGGKVMPQLSGTTIARQFTGLGNGNEAGLLKHLTGGSISPTRSLSPTKQLGASARPRPKSVIGIRSSKCVDEGRGMFLVRQMTGVSSSSQWED